MQARLAAVLSGSVLLASGWYGAPVSAQPTSPAHVARSAPSVSPGRALFNDPFGSPRRQYALVRHIDAAIDAAPRGATIRLAAFSFAMRSTAQSLLRAHRRGVRVKVVVDDRSVAWGSVRNLRRKLGTRAGRHSFVRVCRSSCRGVRGNQHAKFLTLSRSGHASDVVMVGSMNFTAFAAAYQWQDLYTVADTRLFRQLRLVFRRMARDRPQPRLDLPAAGHGMAVDVSPLPGPGPDPLLERVRRVRCAGVSGGTGLHGHTLVRISMHAWNGDRGVRLARQVAGLTRAGCDVRVLAGVGFGRRVTDILRRSGTGYRDSGYVGRYTHQKLMFVSGHFGRRTDASLVWTGSHNWTDRSLRNDEVTLRVAGARHVAAYRANFSRMWRIAGRPEQTGMRRPRPGG